MNPVCKLYDFISVFLKNKYLTFYGVKVNKNQMGIFLFKFVKHEG